MRWERYQTKSNTDAASSAAITQLNAFCKRGDPSRLRIAVPNASHAKPQAIATRKNNPAIHPAWTSAGASGLRYVPEALMLTSQDFGFSHWNAKAPAKPIAS
jgi:hypothetical protein